MKFIHFCIPKLYRALSTIYSIHHCHPLVDKPLPMSVTLVETAFRTLGYIFKYDAEGIVSEVETPGQEPCLEHMRQYYGATLGHGREHVRRLAAETFAPLVRKLPSRNVPNANTFVESFVPWRQLELLGIMIMYCPISLQESSSRCNGWCRPFLVGNCARHGRTTAFQRSFGN